MGEGGGGRQLEGGAAGGGGAEELTGSTKMAGKDVGAELLHQSLVRGTLPAQMQRCVRERTESARYMGATLLLVENRSTCTEGAGVEGHLRREGQGAPAEGSRGKCASRPTGHNEQAWEQCRDGPWEGWGGKHVKLTKELPAETLATNWSGRRPGDRERKGHGGREPVEGEALKHNENEGARHSVAW